MIRGVKFSPHYGEGHNDERIQQPYVDAIAICKLQQFHY